MVSQSLIALIKDHSEKRTRSDGTPYLSLSLEAEKTISRQSELSLREVQIHSLHLDITPERYCRNQNTLTCTDQIRLLESHIAVIGQGGLGGTVTEILARIGVGELTLVDGDVFEESNLNRQLLSMTSNLGTLKALAGKDRVAQINSAVKVNCFTEFFSQSNADTLLNDCTIVVDCLDSIHSRLKLESACKNKKIPLVSAAIGGSAGQATVIFPDDKGLQTIYGNSDTAPEKGAEASMGTLPYTAILLAAVECAETITILCTGDSRLRNSLLLTSIHDHLYEKVKFP